MDWPRFPASPSRRRIVFHLPLIHYSGSIKGGPRRASATSTGTGLPLAHRPDRDRRVRLDRKSRKSTDSRSGRVGRAVACRWTVGGMEGLARGREEERNRMRVRFIPWAVTLGLRPASGAAVRADEGLDGRIAEVLKMPGYRDAHWGLLV